MSARWEAVYGAMVAQLVVYAMRRRGGGDEVSAIAGMDWTGIRSIAASTADHEAKEDHEEFEPIADVQARAEKNLTTAVEAQARCDELEALVVELARRVPISRENAQALAQAHALVPASLDL